MRLRAITVCPACRAFWDAGDSPRCTDEAHRETHLAREIHVHLDDVELLDGSVVVAATFDERDPYARKVVPDFGVYLDTRWQPPWPHVHVDWPDFGVPADPQAVLSSLSAALIRAKAGERVEIGCWGAHGRTGTALACLAVLTGCAPADAVAWVRSGYCEQAVETADQIEFVARL
jgi:hypothetical protein